MPIARLRVPESILLIIDIQERLLAKMPDPIGLVRESAFLIDAAKLLGVPILATEQYPKGLGPTHPDIARRLPANPPAKVAFSCCGATGLLMEIQASNRPSVVLAGMETHVCVMQTALDLLESELTVYLPIDCLQSRFRLDHDTAIRRLEHAGAIVTTLEAVCFEWLSRADHPQFKAVSKMIQDRMAMIGNKAASPA